MIATQKRFSLGDRIMLKDSLNLESTSGVLRFLIKIIKTTVVIDPTEKLSGNGSEKKV